MSLKSAFRSVRLSVSRCACEPPLALDKKPTWSCGLCITDSLGHGQALLPHHHPPSPPLSCEYANAPGSRGGIRRRRCMQVYDKTCVEKSLNETFLPGIQKSKHRLGGLGGVDKRKKGAR